MTTVFKVVAKSYHKVELVFTLRSMLPLPTIGVVYAQRHFSTCSATLLRDKLKENVARITWLLLSTEKDFWGINMDRDTQLQTLRKVFSSHLFIKLIQLDPLPYICFYSPALA